MRIKICLLFVFVISIVIGVSNVEANDIDLVCIYGEGKEKYKLSQNGDKQYLYMSQSDDIKWSLVEHKYELLIYNKDNTVLVDDISYEQNTQEKVGKISECPTYLKKSTNDVVYSYYVFYDETMYSDISKIYPLIPGNPGNEADDDIVPVDSNVFYYQYSDLYREELTKESNKWDAECSYKVVDRPGYDNYVYLYFNKNRYILINENSRCGTNYLNFSINELNDFFVKIYNNCPPRLYMDDSSNDTTGALICNFSLKKQGYYIDLSNEKNIVNVYQPTPEPEEEINDCKSLFGEELLNRIDDIMDIVKIVVPILLIGFGIYDFTKAVFSSSEDAMNKSKKTFLNRIIAAILVFIAPIFINLILDLANEVWSEIKGDTCISQTD